MNDANNITDTTALQIIKSLRRINDDARPITEETGAKILDLLRQVEAAYDADPLAQE